MEVVDDDLLANSLAQFSSVEAEVIAGAKVPTWNDFYSLSQLISQLKSHEAKYADDGKLDQLHEKLKKLETLLLEQFQFNPNFTSYPVSGELEAGAYGLVQAYRQSLVELNQLFPEKVHFIFNEIPEPNVSSEQVIELATAMVTKQKQRIEASLVRLNPEIKTWGQFKKKTEEWVSQQEPTSGYQELYRILSDPKNLLISMRRPETARFWLPMTGFQNQRVTGSSRGSFNRNARDAYEARSFGIDERVYSKLRSDLKPNYGYLRLADSVPYTMPDGAFQYGSDIYDYDYDKLKDRVTFTLGDSLSYADPNALTFGRSMSPIQYLRYAISGIVFCPALVAGDPTQIYLRQLQVSTATSYVGSSYIELQIWGPDFLDYVKRFTFTQNPPSPDFVAELQARGIQIFDGRKDTRNPLPWKSPELPQKKVILRKPESRQGSPLAIPEMIAPDQVRPYSVSISDVLSIFPDAAPTDILFGNGVGVLQTEAMKQKDFFYSIVSSGGSTAVLLPISTDISKFDAGEQYYYSIDNQGEVPKKVIDLTINPYRYLYHFNEVSEEGDFWTDSLKSLFVNGQKVPQLFRSLLKKQCPIKMLNANALSNLQKSGDLKITFYESVQNLHDFKINRVLPWVERNEQPSVHAISSVASRSKLGENSIGLSTLAVEMRAMLSKSISPATAENYDALQLRMNNLNQEITILSLIESGASLEDVKNHFAALHPGPCETDLYDTESFKVVVQDYIDGKL